MANKVFIDTGAYFARFYHRDQYHALSLKIWGRLQAKGFILITTNHVIDELSMLLARRASYDFSAERLQEIYESDMIIERSTEEDELRALEYFKKYADQKVSFTDCLSFMVMENLGISQVFTFDRHFAYAGFDVVSS